MKIICMNYSGNVGKSTACRHFLQPRIEDAELFTVESVNSDGYSEDEVERLYGEQFGTLLPKLLRPKKSVVVDVGASNAEVFVNRLTQHGEAHSYIDYFVIPTVADLKQMRDTVVTLDTLAALGVPANKIRVLLNMVDPRPAKEVAFKHLFDYAKGKKTFVINPAAAIERNELYTKLNSLGLSMSALLEGTDDIDKRLETETDDDEIAILCEQLSARLLAKKANVELDAAFAALFQ